MKLALQCTTMKAVKFHPVHIERRLFCSALQQTGDNKQTGNITSSFTCEKQATNKVLKVAIVGPPNAGKSTLINALVGRRVCSASKKVHTTRHNIRAITVDGSTQLVFLDTPGIVTGDEMRKHKLERSFISNPEEAILEADTIGVVHDVSNKWTTMKLDDRTLRLLEFHSNKNSFLILNKIDELKKKQNLLDIVNILTNKTLKSSPAEISDEEKKVKLSELSVRKLLNEQHGWSSFMEVFMVSALNGDGLGDVKEYLLQQAEHGPWIYKSDQFTDETTEDIILKTVQSRLLEHLPEEVPYSVQPEMEYFQKHPDGRIVSVVLVNCPKSRVGRLVIGPKGRRIKQIAKEAEQDIRDTFHESVFLKLVVRS